MLTKYIAGKNISQAILRGSQILAKDKIPVINYAIENTNNHRDCYKEYQNIISSIDENFRIALKLSSFGFNLKLVKKVLDRAVAKNIRILIDAEDNNNNQLYQDSVNSLICKYNKKSPMIMKTYQMYRKDSLLNLQKDINDFKDYKLGTKMVRGAYWNSEHNQGHLFTNKIDTDTSYNMGIVTLSRCNKNSINILATHNESSISWGAMINKKHDSSVFEFGHLLGMREKRYNKMQDKLYPINVYLPYGPYKEMLPYLSRRLYENLDMVKYAFT